MPIIHQPWLLIKSAFQVYYVGQELGNILHGFKTAMYYLSSTEYDYHLQPAFFWSQIEKGLNGEYP